MNIADHLLGHHPNIIILSEFRNNDAGHLIRTKLLTKGYVFQYGSSSDTTKNGVLIASNIPCNFKGFQQHIKAFPEAAVQAIFPDFSLWGLYLPHKKKHTLFPFLLEQISTEGNHLLMGDFNTGVNGLDQKGDSFWYSEYLKKFEEKGLIDAFRHKNGKARVYSWFSHQGNGYRYDHCWTSRALSSHILECDFDQKSRESGMSDHALMYLNLDLDLGGPAR